MKVVQLHADPHTRGAVPRAPPSPPPDEVPPPTKLAPHTRTLRKLGGLRMLSRQFSTTIATIVTGECCMTSCLPQVMLRVPPGSNVNIKY